MQVKLVGRNAVELLQAMFGETPEALDAVDVVRASGELILPVMDSVVLRVADINEAVIAAPPVRVDDRLGCDATADNRLQSNLRAVRHNLRIDFAAPLQETEDGSLTRRPATALTAHAARAEVAFIDLDLARKRRDALTVFGNALTNLEKDHGDRFTPDARQLCDIGGAEIHGEVAQQLAEFTLGNSGTRVVAVTSFHSSSLAPT